MLYQYGNHRIDTTVLLPLPRAKLPGASSDLVVIFFDTPLVFDLEPHWFWQYPDTKDVPYISLGKKGETFFVNFLHIANFKIDVSKRIIHCFPEASIPEYTLVHFLIDQVIPRVLSSSNTVLHASSVVINQKAVIFLGEAGWGKSTLAAYLCQQGLPVLTDDCLFLETRNNQIYGVPSYPAIRLWQDSTSALFEQTPNRSFVTHYNSKERILLNKTSLPYCDSPVPLKKIYMLTAPDQAATLSEIEIAQISRQKAFIELVKHTYRLDMTDKDRLRKEFDEIGNVLDHVGFAQLTYPRDMSKLASVHDAIIADLASAD